MAELRTCSLQNNVSCSEEVYFKSEESFSDRQIFLLQRRSGVDNVQTVCSNHEKAFLTFYNLKQTHCCNPLQIHANKIRESLWTITEEFKILHKDHYPNVLDGDKLCLQCKIAVSKDVTIDSPMTDTPEYVVAEESLLRETSGLSFTSELDHAPSTHSTFLTPPELTLERINDSLRMMNLQPVTKQQLSNSSFKSRKIHEILFAYSVAFNKVSENENIEETAMDSDTDYGEAGKEMISQLKRKFPVINSNGDKIKLLSVLPGSWSLSKVQKEFNVSKHMAAKTKQLVEDQGVLCTSTPKVGNLLPQQTTDQVTSFYLDPEVSREMSGKKDYVSVVKDGKRMHIQKRLVLGNLKEIFLCYCEKYPDSKVSFSKFAMLRPKECILAGASGTHTVCVCTNHHNFKLMLLDANLKSLKLNDKSLISYKDFLDCMKCVSPSESCHLRQYKNRFNIMNVCLHEKDFGIPAEWHFYATSHGKGPSDGLGGTLKRLATRTSLQRQFDNQLQTPEQLYHWAKDNISGMQFSYASKTDIAILTKMLNKRFHCSTPITGIRSFHACLPRADGHACMKIHSFSKDETQFHVLHNWDKEDTTATAVSDLPRVTRSSKRKKCIS